MKTTIVVAENRRVLTYEMQQTMERFDTAFLQRAQSIIVIKAAANSKEEDWMYRFMTVDDVLNGKSLGLSYWDFYFVGGVPVNLRKEIEVRERLKAGVRR